MIRLPWDPDEIGAHDGRLDRVAERLSRYATEQGTAADPSLAHRIRAAIEAEPLPQGPWWRRLRGVAPLRGPARVLAAAVVVVAGVVGGMALGEFAQLIQRGGAGSTPPPAVTTPSPRPSPTITPSASPSASPSPSPSADPAPAQPSVPEASPSEELETPEPSEDDEGNSGPGGGGDDGGNSGPGGGDDSP